MSWVALAGLFADYACTDCGKPMKEHPRDGCEATKARIARVERIMNGMRRHDMNDFSRLHCPCGESYEWAGIDDGLEPWLFAHEAHIK